jgi:hypothetical protein
MIDRLTMSYVLITYRHTLSSPGTPPSLLRRALSLSLSFSPSHPVYLRLMGDLEAKSQLENRMRQFFSFNCKRHKDDVYNWIFYIVCELGRGEGNCAFVVFSENILFFFLFFTICQVFSCGILLTYVVTGTRQHVRRILEESLSSHLSGSAVLLWRLYLQLEHRTDQKEVRGIECVWCDDASWSGKETSVPERILEKRHLSNCFLF